MRLLFVYTLTLSTVISLSAQQTPATEGKNDTVYINNGNGVLESVYERCDAVGYYINENYKEGAYTRNVFYLDEPVLLASYQCYDERRVDLDFDVRIRTIKNGLFEEYYPNGQTKVLCKYVENKLDGDFKVFYPDGQLKRYDIWHLDKLQEGMCFDENGLEMPYYLYIKPPEFPGGRGALNKYISKNFKYPEVAREIGIDGLAVYKFTVDESGSIYNVYVLKGLYPIADKECMEFIKVLPRWRPAVLDGTRYVQYTYIMPWTFRLK